MRDALRLTQQEFADLLDVAHSSIHNWEAGRNRPHRGTLRRIRELKRTRAGQLDQKSARKRVSEDTRVALLTALDTILERAPSAVIEEVGRRLTNYAGKYGEEK